MIELGKLLPLISQLGTYLKMGADHYADLRSSGKDAGPEVVAFFLEEKMRAWNPEIAGKPILDDATRSAGARFLAGVAINITSA